MSFSPTTRRPDASEPIDAVERMLGLRGGDLDASVARAVLRADLDPVDERRLNELRSRDDLSEAEREELRSLANLVDRVALWWLKARRTLDASEAR